MSWKIAQKNYQKEIFHNISHAVRYATSFTNSRKAPKGFNVDNPVQA